MPENQELKTLSGRVVKMDRPASTKNPKLIILKLAVVEDNAREGQKPAQAVAFADTAKNLQDSIGEALSGATLEQIMPAVTLRGYWKKQPWTGRDGKERHSWEFNIKEFDPAV